MLQGRLGKPYSFSTSLKVMEYISSELMSKPSESKMQARTGGKAGIVNISKMLLKSLSSFRLTGYLGCRKKGQVRVDF